MDEALLQAAAEGLPLIHSRSASGYKSVHPRCSRFVAAVSGQDLGTFATAEQAALCYSRHIGKDAAVAEAAKAAAAAHDMTTVAEVLQQAAAEGLPLIRSETTASGFTCVTACNGGRYMAVVNHRSLGTFATAEQAALCYSRHIGREAAEAAAAEAAAKAASVTPGLTAAAALQQAATEGLPLVRTAASATGFKCVSALYGRFVLRVGRAKLGTFASAEHAALAYSRHLGKEEAVRAAAKAGATKSAAPRRDRPPTSDLTVAEAVRAAEDEGLPLVGSSGASGYKGVTREGGRFAVNRQGGRAHPWLGSYATAEQAALVYARSIGREAAVAAQEAAVRQRAAAEATRTRMTAEEAVRQAAAEGLPLVRAAETATGYRGVTPYGPDFKASFKGLSLGVCPTAELAALVYARHIGKEAADAAATVEAEIVAAKAAKEEKKELNLQLKAAQEEANVTAKAAKKEKKEMRLQLKAAQEEAKEHRQLLKAAKALVAKPRRKRKRPPGEDAHTRAATEKCSSFDFEASFL